MRTIALSVALVAAAHTGTAAAVSLTFAPDYRPCVTNCAQITQAGNALVATLLDQAGKPFKVTTTALDPAATKAIVSASQRSAADKGLFGAPAESGEFAVAAINTTVETGKDTVIYTLIAYYRHGQLFDATMTDARFPK